MADILVTCPSCQGQITCDDAWAGQEVSCPHCNQALTVPAKSGAGGAAKHNPLVPVPPSGPGKLGLGGGSQQPATPGKNIPIRNLATPVQKKKNPLAAMLPVLGIVIVLGASGYFGWPYFKEWREKRAAGSEEAQAAAAAAAAATNTPPPPPAAITLPALPATWTLDVAAAQITDGRANGTLSGTNFLVDAVQAVEAGGASVLRFIQGPAAAPEREVMIYVKLNPGESLAGQNISVSKEARSPLVQMVAKRVKGRLQPYAAGFVLKLEMGAADATGNTPGKVYLALPDKEKSVMAGKFDLATTSLTGGMPGGMPPGAQMEMMRRRGTPTRPPGN